MIYKFLLNTQIIRMIFIKILKNAIQIKKENFNCSWWYDCWYTKWWKLYELVNELFIRGRKLTLV